MIISHDTALLYWLSDLPEARAVALRETGRVRAGTSGFGAAMNPALEVEAELARLCDLSAAHPVHVVRSGARSARRHDVVFHAVAEVPAREVRVLGEGLAVCSPAWTFTQICATRGLVESVFWGTLLTASFARGIPGGEIVNREPVATCEEFERFAREHAGMRGLGMMRRALGYVRPFSASPMEAVLAMHIGMPLRLGGAGFSDVRCNHRVEVPAALRPLFGATHYRCDVYLPEWRIGIEYDSDAHHTGPSRIAHDARRRNALEGLGVTVLTVTRRQLLDFGQREALFRTLCRLTGKRGQARYDLPTRRLELGQELQRLLRCYAGVLRP